MSGSGSIRIALVWQVLATALFAEGANLRQTPFGCDSALLVALVANLGDLAALTKIAQRPAVLLSVALVNEQAELLCRGVAQSVRGPDRAVA